MTDGTKPCGKHHPLPCGLDRICPVPSEYHDADLDSDEIWSRYTSEE